ncbi:MAG TPA: hypothetical protein VHV50_11990 [Actinomycetota bacterium]|jgi:hypothetical protein|nr:hypothetical protein [Actinomycetota bacterium]
MFRRGPARLYLALAGVVLLLAACSGTGIDAGGESETNNGGIAFVAMAGMLIVIGLVLWWIIGRED